MATSSPSSTTTAAGVSPTTPTSHRRPRLAGLRSPALPCDLQGHPRHLGSDPGRPHRLLCGLQLDQRTRPAGGNRQVNPALTRPPGPPVPPAAPIRRGKRRKVMIIRIRTVYDDRLWRHSSTSTISPAVTANERLSHLQSGRDRALRRSLPRPPGQRLCAARGSTPAGGWRSVIALASGRAWITILGWTTRDTARLPLDLRRRLQPRRAAGYSRRRRRAAIRARPSHVGKARTIRAAVASLKLQP